MSKSNDKILFTVKGIEPFKYIDRKTKTEKTCNPLKEMHVYQSVLKELIEISCSEYDGSCYDPYSEMESFEYLDPNIDLITVIDYFTKNGYWNDFCECESQSEFEDRLQDYINDSIVDLCPKLEQNDIPEINFNSQQHYNPCDGCGHEDCACCSYGRGY